MDGMLSLFETVVHSSCQDQVLHAFLKACTDQQTFLNKTSNALQSVISNINSKLNAPVTRYEGLLLLKAYLPQCSVDVFGEHTLFWMQQCLKAGDVNQNEFGVVSISYQVLKILFQMSEHLPEMKRTITGQIVSKVIENFLCVKVQEAPLSAFECLEALMLNYGPSCAQQKNLLEKYLLQYVDCKDQTVVKKVALCVAYLPLLGGGGSSGVNNVTRWHLSHQIVCATLHGVLDELFDGIIEVPNSYSGRTSPEKLALPTISETTSLMRVQHLVTRFINITKYLQALIISEFPVDKKILPDAILGVICRGLAVNSRTLRKKVSTDILMVGAMLPQVHIALLKLLESLITCCRSNLFQYGSVICRLALQTLKWTSEDKCPYGVQKPFTQLREAACNMLTLWLKVSNSGSSVELIADQLVPILIEDIWFQKEAVSLVAMKGTKGNKKQLKSSEQKKIVSDIDTRSLKKQIPNRSANSNICRAALQLLQWLLHAAAPFIKASVHRLLQEKTVVLLFEIQRTNKLQDFPIPFSEASCRLELYNLLYTLTLEPHLTWPPPLQFAFHSLSAGRKDSSLKVSSFCTKALAAIEKLVHPPSGTLQFPVSLKEMLEATKNYQKEIVSAQEHANSFNMECEEEVIQNEESLHQEEPQVVNKSKTKEGGKKGSSSSEDLEIVYENYIEEDEDEEGDESEESVSEQFDEGMISENEDVTVVSEESTSSEKELDVKYSMLADISERVPEAQDRETPVVDIAESDAENEKNLGSASTLVYGSSDRCDENNEFLDTSRQQKENKLVTRFEYKSDNDNNISENKLNDDDDHISNSVNKINDIENGGREHENVSPVSCKRKANERAYGHPESESESPVKDSIHNLKHDGQKKEDAEVGTEEKSRESPHDDDDINEDEPRAKKLKTNHSESVEAVECSESNLVIKTNKEISKEDGVKEDINGKDLDSVEEQATEEEMLSTFVDVVKQM